MLPNEFPSKSTFYRQSPFKKVVDYPNNIPMINPINKTKQLFQPNYSKEKYIIPPIKFGLNFYLAQPKTNFYQPIMYPYKAQPQEFYYHNYNPETLSINELFKNSLAKSGYQLTQEQSVKYKDIYNRPNIMNNNNNNIYDNFNYCPINNNNNIINNIYPTFTKVTNVHILSDNDKINENKKEIKKENINLNNNNSNKEIKIKKEETINSNNNNNSNNKKVLFECSETNGIDIKSKNFLRKKRVRKNSQQLGLLSQFYSENKNWSKKQIREISEKTGLKENKIYKWLWDQKNKEFKATKFVVNK